MSAIDDVSKCIQELRSLHEEFRRLRPTGSEHKEVVKKVRSMIVKLRRNHAKLREQQKAEQKQVADVILSLHRAKVAAENSRFLGGQCEFLVEKYNSIQFPELEKAMASLPSIEEYTQRHKNDPGFVSYEANSHQFMLNMLSEELKDRDSLAKEIKDLEERQAVVKRDINSKRDLLASMSTKLLDVSRSVEALVSVLEKP